MSSSGNSETVASSGFDNRSAFGMERLVAMARRFKARITGTAAPLGAYGQHFWFEHDGRRFIYAYIRKNACTSFKNFICATSRFREKDLPQQEKIAFLTRYHTIDSLTEIQDSDFLLFVYRDPVRRFASLFKNKFVIRDGSVGLFRNVRQLSDHDPEVMSAHDLLMGFLARHLDHRDARLRPTIDHHLLPQRLCIGMLDYHAAIAMEDLYPRMAALIGGEAADRYFARPANSSTHPAYDEDVSRISSAELHRRYLSSGMLPSDTALVTPAMETALRQFYSADFDMIDEIGGLTRSRAANVISQSR